MTHDLLMADNSMLPSFSSSKNSKQNMVEKNELLELVLFSPNTTLV